MSKDHQEINLGFLAWRTQAFFTFPFRFLAYFDKENFFFLSHTSVATFSIFDKLLLP